MQQHLAVSSWMKVDLPAPFGPKQRDVLANPLQAQRVVDMQNDLSLRRTVASWTLTAGVSCAATNYLHDLGDNLDLNKSALGQLVDRDARTGRQRFAE